MRAGRAGATMDAGRWERKGNWLARAPLRQGHPSRIGRYRLTARLGAGGMGVVYLGETPQHLLRLLAGQRVADLAGSSWTTP